MKKLFGSLLLLLLAAFAWGNSAAAAVKVIKVDNPNASLESPAHIGLEAMKKYIEEHTGGEYRVDIYDGGKLGAPNTVVQGMKMGTIHGGMHSASNLAPFNPLFNLLDAPYLFKNYAQADAVLNGPVGKKIAAPIARSGAEFIGYIPSTFRWHMLKKPVRSPEEASGLKIRSTASKVDIANLDAMGFSPTNVTAAELVTALQQGTVVGLAPGAENVASEKTLAKLAPYAVATEYAYMPMCFIASSKWLKSLPEADRKIIEAGIQEGIRVAGETSRTMSTPEAIRNTGLYTEVIELTPEQKDAFIKSTRKVYDTFPAEWQEIVKDIRKELKDQNL